MKFKPGTVTLIEESAAILYGKNVVFGTIYRLNQDSQAYFARLSNGGYYHLEDNTFCWTLHLSKGEPVFQGFNPDIEEETREEERTEIPSVFFEAFKNE